MKKFLLPGIIVLSVILSVGFVGYSFLVTSNLSSQIVAQDGTIKEMETELNSIEKQQSEIVDVKVVLNSAAQAGTEVAAYQSKFATMSNEERENLGTMAEKMRNLFSASDSGATVPWYTGNTASDYTWKFETTYSFSGKTAPVLWLCRDKEQNVLAYATADYLVEDNVFDDVEWNTVSRGSFRMAEDVADLEGVDRDDIWKALIKAGQEKLEATATSTPDVTSSSDAISSSVPTSSPDMATDIGREDLPADLVSKSIEAGYPLPDREPQRTPEPEVSGNYSDFGTVG